MVALDKDAPEQIVCNRAIDQHGGGSMGMYPVSCIAGNPAVHDLCRDLHTVVVKRFRVVILDPFGNDLHSMAQIFADPAVREGHCRIAAINTLLIAGDRAMTFRPASLTAKPPVGLRCGRDPPLRLASSVCGRQFSNLFFQPNAFGKEIYLKPSRMNSL